MSKLKLMSRRELDTAKSKDRFREIEEGKKLASRIDILRQTAADEENNLEQFRVKTVAQLQQEIDTKIIEKSKLDEELTQRREERRSLMKPLHEAWEDVHTEKAKIELEKEEVAQSKNDLNMAISANIQREYMNKIETERQSDDRKTTNKLLSDAKKMNKEAASDLMDARSQVKSILNNAQAVEQGALQREKNVTVLEGLVEQRRLQNEREMVANNEERIRVRDAYATLERIKNRIK